MDDALSNLEKFDSEQSDAETRPDSSPSNSLQAFVKCPHCGTGISTVTASCPGCGQSMTPIPVAERAAAAAAYLTFIAGAVILFVPALRNNRFVRFHAWQSILLWGVFFVLASAALLLSNVVSIMLILVSGILASLAMFFLWIVLSLKAWEGERFELPLFGQLAAKMK
jgi:uncharacterized membrane protein